MDDDQAKPGRDYPLSASKMSKTPSWIMLGFVLGAAFVAALPPLRKSVTPEPPAFKATEAPRPAGRREPPQLTTIEAVFAVWGRYAVWSDDVTEVALWNIRDKAFSDFYEVRRIGDQYYFRTLSKLTRRVISRGKTLTESPLLFTETEEQYREWVAYGRSEQAVEQDLRPPVPPRSERRELLVAPTVDSATPPPAPPPLEKMPRPDGAAPGSTPKPSP